MILHIPDSTGHTTITDPVKVKERVGEALAEEFFRMVVATDSGGNSRQILNVGEIREEDSLTLVGPFQGG